MTVVGILADSTALAASIASELHITRPLLLSPANLVNALMHEEDLSVVLVDDAQWPLDLSIAEHVIPCVLKNLGYVIHLDRVNPKDKIPVRRTTSAT